MQEKFIADQSIKINLKKKGFQDMLGSSKKNLMKQKNSVQSTVGT